MTQTNTGGSAQTIWSDLARLELGPRDPLAIIAEQNAERLPELVPLRIERMGASPFAFYRGTAALMAADLAAGTDSGINVAACGDAHLGNFGFYASPSRDLVFDLNDFDEAAWAPWEWDLKRLATSRAADVVTGAASAAVRRYLETMSAAMQKSPLERYYTHLDLRQAKVTKDSRAALKSTMKAARKRTGDRALARLTQTGPDGGLRFRDDPPALTRTGDALSEQIQLRYAEYSTTANVDVRLLLRHYSLHDVALRPVGVGSVGTRCYLALLADENGNGLILQIKEAGAGVLQRYGRVAQPPELDDLVTRSGHGPRVVALQRILQATSDPFLGHIQAANSFYVRQFHDLKGSVEVTALTDAAFGKYASTCGWVLARAHSQSPRAAEIPGLVRDPEEAITAILDWSRAYAAVSTADYEQFVAAYR